MKTPDLPEEKPSAPSKRKFNSGDPRGVRAALLLLRRPVPRWEIDSATGAANGPDLVFRLRRKTGAEIPCKHIDAIDRDGRPCRPGIFHLTTSDRPKLARWLKSIGG